MIPDIDKINAPHPNAHWNLDDVKQRKSFDFAVKLFGTPEGRLSLPQWFGMVMAYDRYVAPFAEPITLS